MRGVNDDEETGRPVRTHHPSKRDVDCNTFVRGSAIEAIDAWQVDEIQCAMLQLHRTHVLFNGHAGEIAGRLAQTRQAVEQRALTGVGITDNCY